MNGQDFDTSMSLPEYISLNDAINILKCLPAQLKYRINQGLLHVYIKRPVFFQAPRKHIYEPDHIMPPLHLSFFWQQPLADLCRLKPPITWTNGRVECLTIIVTDTDGVAPSASDSKLASPDGRIGPDGEIDLRIGWNFPEEDIKLNSDDVIKLLVKNRNEKATGHKEPAATTIKKSPTRKPPKPGPGRKPAEFTLVIDSLFSQLLEEGNIEVLRPRQTVAFLNCLKDRSKELTDNNVKEHRLKDDSRTYAELVEYVKTSDCVNSVLMKSPRLVKRKCKERLPYTRSDVSKRLSELRGKHPEKFIVPR